MNKTTTQPTSRRISDQTSQSSKQSMANLVSPKLKKIHFDRLAIVYVRQSSPHQVRENRESTALQYALVDRATQLGFHPEQVIVIDEDQAQSGTSIVARTGFQRLLTEVSNDKIGLILGIEMSRLARSCKDWHALLEICAIYQTLLLDTDGIYDPSEHNDRLLLGLKGTMSEAELHLLKNRMYRGLCNKAERGEVLNHAPIGYIRTLTNNFVIDPDESVQSVVRTIFDRFAKWGSISGLLKSLVRDNIQIPVRPHFGDDRGELQWRRPNRVTLLNVMHHPIYAGAYRWGHRDVDARKKIPGRPYTGRTLRDYKDCRVLIQDRFDAYISWEQFENNQQKLQENSRLGGRFSSPVGRGKSLLAGLLVCGRCGRNMCVSYGSNRLRYTCQRGAIDYGGAICQSLSGNDLDESIGRLLLESIRPASLELSLAAANDIAKERADNDRQWKHRLERIDYETELSRRSYAAVDPEHRLVARQLERRWEEKLSEQESLHHEYQRFASAQPSELSTSEREQIHALSENIESLWHSASTTSEDRQTIARLLLDRVVVTVNSANEQVDIEVHWVGGFNSHHHESRPVDTYKQMSNYSELVARMTALQSAGRSCAEIAICLNSEGYRPPKRSKTFDKGIVTRLLASLRIEGGDSRKFPSDRTHLAEDEWWLSELAVELKMPIVTLHRWVRVGWIQARKVAQVHGQWALYANATELERLKKLRNYRRGWGETKTPIELTKPQSNEPINKQ